MQRELCQGAGHVVILVHQLQIVEDKHRRRGLPIFQVNQKLGDRLPDAVAALQPGPATLTTPGRDRLERRHDARPELHWVAICLVQGQPRRGLLRPGRPGRQQ